jgi:flavin-dependent dehydrogenase
LDVKVEDGKLVVTVSVSDEDGVRKLVGALGLNTVLTALLGLKPVAPATKAGRKPKTPETAAPKV